MAFSNIVYITQVESDYEDEGGEILGVFANCEDAIKCANDNDYLTEEENKEGCKEQWCSITSYTIK